MTTLTIPDHLTKSLSQCNEVTLLEIFKKGLVQYQQEKKQTFIEEQSISAPTIPKNSHPTQSNPLSKTAVKTESTSLLKLLEQCPLNSRTSSDIDKQFQALRDEWDDNYAIS